MAEKRILPLPPYLRFLLDVPSVANAEITSQETLMALEKDKDKKDKKKVPGDKDQGPETPSEPPEDPREPMTGLPYDILGDLFDLAKDVSKMSSGDEDKKKTLEVGVEVKDRKPVVPTSLTVADEKAKDFFETSNEFESIEGRIEDVESRYYGGVGDLGDNQAAKTIQKIDGYDDYVMYLQEQAENFLGPEFKGFRITNTKEVMQLLNKQNKNKIKSFTLNPKQAIKFGYFANEAFMDPITTQPRGDLLIVESPIKSNSLVMRGRPEEAEVVSNTAGTSIKQFRIYNPYTGEVVYEPTEGPLVGTEPHQFDELINTKTQKSSFLDDLKGKFIKEAPEIKYTVGEQGSFMEELERSSELKKRVKDAEAMLEYFESRNMDQEADELRKEINEFKIKNNI